MASPTDRARVFTEALETLGYVEVAKRLAVEPAKIRLLLRVQKEHLVDWLKIVEQFLRIPIEGQLHICQVYFLKGADRKNSQLTQSWHIAVISSDIEPLLERLLAVILDQDTAKEVKDGILVAANEKRGMRGVRSVAS